MRPRFYISLFCLLLVSGAFLHTHDAYAKLDLYNPRKNYADEKKTITNPTSRCVTATTKKLQQNNIVAAEKTWASLSVTSSTEPAAKAAYEKYQNELTVIWSAMEAPYCGFGAFGTTAAIHSYQKSIDHAHTEFLKELAAAHAILNAKKAPAVAVPNVGGPTTVAATPSTTPLTTERTQNVASTPTTDALDTSLEKGMRSAQVSILQELLSKDSTVYPQKNVTGYFGEQTRQAVIAFQKKHGLVAGSASPGAGLVGPKTRKALNEYLGG